MTKRREKTHQFGGVIEVFSSPKGLSYKDLEYTINQSLKLTGNPEDKNSKKNKLFPHLKTSWQKTKEIRAPVGDVNNLKVSLRCFSKEKGKIKISSGLTDYFTLWGLPQTNPDLQKKGVKDIISKGKTLVPIGISTHNILITPDGLVVRVSSRAAGFSAGRISISLEEQMEPTLDSTPMNTAFRGFQEELGILVSPEKIKLLGIALELNTSYTCFCYVAQVSYKKESLRKATDIKETEAIFIVPPNEIDDWVKNEVKPEVWKKYADKSCPIDPNATLNPHPTAFWRVKLLKKFLKKSFS